MGDMADWILERGEYEYKDSHVLKPTKPFGPGNCPKCNKKTRLLEGKFGKFYGCIDFPICTGSRDFNE